MPPDSRLALSHTGLTLRAMSESLAARSATSIAWCASSRSISRRRRATCASRTSSTSPRGARTPSTGCSAAWPRTAPATMRCATRWWRRTCAPTSQGRDPLLREELQRAPSAQVAAELLGAAGDERDSERAWAHAQLAQAAERDGDAGELVTALLADGATAAALSAAEKLPVPVPVRLELARIAAVDDLDAALKHYRLLVAAELETSERESYGNAVRHLRAMRKAADAHGRAPRSSRSRTPRARSTAAAARSSRCSTSSAGGRRAARATSSDEVELAAHGQRALREGAPRACRCEHTQTGSSRASRHWPRASSAAAAGRTGRRPIPLGPQSLARQHHVAQQSQEHAVERVGRAQAEQGDTARPQHALQLDQAGDLALAGEVPDAVAGEDDRVELVLVLAGARPHPRRVSARPPRPPRPPPVPPRPSTGRCQSPRRGIPAPPERVPHGRCRSPGRAPCPHQAEPLDERALRGVQAAAGPIARRFSARS